MKQIRLIFLLLLLLGGTISCSPGHTGTNIIAFLRAGHLWTIDPDGANALEIVSQSTPIVSYGWSPSHQLLMFRMLDPDFAKTAAAKQLASNAITGEIGDVPSILNTLGIDGGSPISIAFSSPDVRYSTAMWNSTGTRLLYRETAPTPPQRADGVRWWVSQNDQPGGIALKSLPSSYSIPSLSYANQTQDQMAIGNSSQGLSTTTVAGMSRHYLQRDPLVGHPLPASLERVLWQPGHHDSQFLYALPAPTHHDTFKVQLILRMLSGHTTTLAMCSCQQFAWSPDGNAVLYSTASGDTILNLTNHSSFNISGSADSVPYWSPDSQFLLLDGLHSMALVHVKDGQQKILVSDTKIPSPTTTDAGLPSTTALLQPVTNSIWAADSHHFLFLTHNRLLWQGQPLSAGKGLYTVTIDDTGHPQGMPTLIDAGNDTQPGWTYQDVNTSFLY